MSKTYSNFSKINELLDGKVSYYLDFIRGLAAILVLMEHMGSRLFVGYGYLQNPNAYVKLLYLLNLLGGPSVVVFFVLSGLFISRSVLKAIFENKWSWKSYLVSRLSRLYIVLIPALLLTCIADYFAINYFNYQRYIDDYYLNVKEFFGNLFFLQNFYVRSYGSNGPLWSLGYEFWYYMLFPLLIMMLRNQRKVIKIVCLIIALSILFVVGKRTDSYFLIWLIGTIVLFLPSIRLAKNKIFMFMSFLILCFAMILRPLVGNGRLFIDHHTDNLFFVDILIGLSMGLLIYTLLHVNTKNKENVITNKWFEKKSKLLASFSFSLYLIHYPIINLVYFWAAKNGFTGFQPNLLSVLIEIMMIVLMCMIAFLFSRITEARTNVIRTFIMSRIEMSKINKHQVKEMKSWKQ
ncbi:acyltransferase family protein [Paenibacillus planticolens]|uniref:Acyltransferase family protein n=1 Tax=Paenibacillus planticolens TaxID=2654976 RepID=A0ABX1ZML0_9BACL|nr:acyltransferase [Paenibacillus planticolens]NOV01330.1 acyltransferase family protein [Paenibacillus planticolens]